MADNQETMESVIFNQASRDEKDWIDSLPWDTDKDKALNLLTVRFRELEAKLIVLGENNG